MCACAPSIGRIASIHVICVNEASQTCRYYQSYIMASIYRFRIIILMFTFVGYMSYHLSRKPISVVKTELFNCTNSNKTSYSDGSDGVNCTSWIGEQNQILWPETGLACHRFGVPLSDNWKCRAELAKQLGKMVG